MSEMGQAEWTKTRMLRLTRESVPVQLEDDSPEDKIHT